MKISLLFHFLLLSAAVSAETWPFFRGNQQMTGDHAGEFAPPLDLAWTFESGGKEGFLGTAVIDGEGRVFIGSLDGVFYCLDLATGEEKWSFAEKLGKYEGSACFVDDLVVVGSGDSFVYGLNRETGEQAWKFETFGEVLGSPNLFTDPETGEQTIVIGSYDNTFYGLDAKTGEKRWEYETDNYINGAPAISGRGVLFGGCDGFLYQVDAGTGEEIGKIEMGSYVANTIAVDSGIAYTAHYGNRVAAYALEAGELIWEVGEREFPYFSSPAVTAANVFVGARDKRMYCFERGSGDLVWEFRARDEIDSSPVVCADTHLYFGSGDGFLYCLDTKTGEEVWSYEIGAVVGSSPAIANKFLVIASEDGNVYAFRKE